MVLHVVILLSVYLLNADVQKRKKQKIYKRVLANPVKNKCLVQLELQVMKAKYNYHG